MRPNRQHTPQRPGCSRRAWRLAAGLIALLSPLLAPAGSLAGEASEYQVKAGFVLNIVRYTEWPAGELAKAQEIKICTVGSAPLKQAFNALNGKIAKGKPIAVSHLAQVDYMQGCHAIFFGESQLKQIPRALKALKNAPVLTISEIEEFPEAGGMVNLLVERNKTVLEINNAAVRKANLQMSAQVLKVAKRLLE